MDGPFPFRGGWAVAIEDWAGRSVASVPASRSPCLDRKLGKEQTLP